MPGEIVLPMEAMRHFTAYSDRRGFRFDVLWLLTRFVEQMP